MTCNERVKYASLTIMFIHGRGHRCSGQWKRGYLPGNRRRPPFPTTITTVGGERERQETGEKKRKAFPVQITQPDLIVVGVVEDGERRGAIFLPGRPGPALPFQDDDYYTAHITSKGPS